MMISKGLWCIVKKIPYNLALKFEHFFYIFKQRVFFQKEVMIVFKWPWPSNPLKSEVEHQRNKWEFIETVLIHKSTFNKLRKS